MTPHEAPLTEQDGREYGGDGNFVKNKNGTKATGGRMV
jgi:hypothetical protein